jgi:NADPH-dependent 2,4-dienoyl-CoA reductase/sulfur reductase-like enzyme/rhodanese-related sulfurtransferase
MSKKVVVIGGVALGTKAACRLKRIEPEAEVILIDKDEYISYGGCGIPYYVSGDVADSSALQSTAFHMVRNEQFFRDIKGFDAVTGTEVTKIDRAKKVVLTKNKAGEEKEFPYDFLVIGTGSRPRDLKIKGQELKGIHPVGNLQDAINIKDMVARGDVEKAVIVGAGFIGLEMAESLADMWGIDTTVVEVADQIMPGFASKAMAQVAMKTMEENDVKFCLDEMVQAFEGDGSVQRVVTNKRTLEADLVIMAVGIQTNSGIAKEAGLATGITGGIVVNEKLQTSDPNIYSGGDCVEIENIMTGKPGYYPLGSIANRHGRVIGTNLAGGNASIGGAVGSYCVKIFEGALAGAGLTVDNAIKAGYDAVSVMMCQLDRAHFYPEKNLMYLELVVEKGTKRILGIQGYGNGSDAMVGRINAVAATLKYKPVIQDISNLEFAYSPPFSSAMDIVNALANVADNLLDGYMKPLALQKFEEAWENRDSGDYVFIDCRELPDARIYLEKYPDVWKSIPQGEIKKRADEIPKDKKIILLCNTGVRSYEAQLNLKEVGIDNAVTVQGGVAFLKKWGSSL